MTDTHTGDTDIHIDVIPTKMVEGEIINQEDQVSFKSCSHSIEEMRLEQARMIDWICILLITTSIVASTVSFCITKSMLSFSFLSLLSLLPSLRRRKEEAIFPLSREDLQIKLKELEVECERIRQQSKSSYLPLFNWLKHVLRKQT